VAYIKLFDFTHKNIEEALRALLATFRLPGEAQVIDRIVDSFAKHWFETYQGQQLVLNTDAAFILAFAIILLNVDQHNPKNKKPMTLNDFVRNQRGLNKDKTDFPRDFLEHIYNSIKTNEIVMPEEQEGDLREDYEWKVGCVVACLLVRSRASYRVLPKLPTLLIFSPLNTFVPIATLIDGAVFLLLVAS
jgi:golgi-specific brefeldin A-resistance guanine nucleotide exchange factor 1